MAAGTPKPEYFTYRIELLPGSSLEDLITRGGYSHGLARLDGMQLPRRTTEDSVLLGLFCERRPLKAWEAETRRVELDLDPINLEYFLTLAAQCPTLVEILGQLVNLDTIHPGAQGENCLLTLHGGQGEGPTTERRFLASSPRNQVFGADAWCDQV